MRLHFTSPIFILFLISSNLLFGQEIPDSLLLKPKQDHGFSIPEMNDFRIDLNEPGIIPEKEKRWEKYIFKDKTWTQFQLKEGVKKLPDGRLYLTYASANQSFHYFTTSDPVSLQFDFHLKPLIHWEKLDIYLFGNGLLFNKYLDDGEKFIDLQSKAFLWETGVGIDYEYKEKSICFMNTLLDSRINLFWERGIKRV